MKVRELIAQLQSENPDGEAEVVLSSDGEGNRYSPLADLSRRRYRAESTWAGEVGYAALTDEMRAAGYTEEDVFEDGVDAVVLYPTN